MTDNGKGAESEKGYSVVSMFSGCGGLDLGFRGDFEFLGQRYARLPFRVVWANDINAAACETYRRNLDDIIIRADVWDAMDTLPERADVTIGGFPCQDISINGKRNGVAGNRSGLYRAMVEVVARTRPRVFVAENVKGLLLRYNEDSLRRVLADFSGLGYRVAYHLYHAAGYGVPQTRERVFIVGTSRRAKPFEPPEPTRARSDWISAKEAIGDLEGVEESTAINHIWSRANHSPDQGSRKTKENRPADTIRAEHHGNIHYHYSLPRRLSMREAARFQSFPDDFIFAAKLRETERQVGNAVPPVLAWHIARAVANCLS